MIAEIRRLLAEVPFHPFTIVTSSGKQYLVASPDHAGFNPSGTRVIVWFDDESSVHVSALHITAVQEMTVNSQPAC